MFKSEIINIGYKNQKTFSRNLMTKKSISTKIRYNSAAVECYFSQEENQSSHEIYREEQEEKYNNLESNSFEDQPKISLPIGRPTIQSHIRNLFAKKVATANYFQALSKSLLCINEKLHSQTKKKKKTQHSKINSKVSISTISEFVENEGIFLRSLQFLTSNRFPSIEKIKEDKINFNLEYLTEYSTRTFGFALRLLNDNQSKLGAKKVSIRQIDIRCIYLASILVIGVGKIELDEKQNQSISQRFLRVVSDLLERTKFLSNITMTYISEHWESIMEMVRYESIQTETQTQEESAFMFEEIKQKFEQTLKFPDPQGTSNQVEKSTQEETSTYKPACLEKVPKKNNNCFFEDDFSFDGCFTNYIEQERLNPLIEDDLISSYLSSEFLMCQGQSFQSSHSRNSEINTLNNQQYMKESMKECMKDQDSCKNESPKIKQKANIQIDVISSFEERQKWLKQRAEQIFNYKKKNSRKASERKSHTKESNCFKGGKKPKKAHPEHKTRQIDAMIDMLIDDQFVIAHAIANHIYHSLKVQQIQLID